MAIKDFNAATKTFWIDLGNVMFFFDYALFLDKIKDSLTTSPTQAKELIFTSAFTADFERGLIDEEEFFRQFSAQAGLRIHKEYFFEAFSDIFWVNTPFVKFVKDVLKPAYRLILVSNINKIHFHFLQKNYPEIFGLFDHLILSYRVRSIKPEQAIYEAALRVSGGGIESVIYIDDRKDLTDATLARGIESICFRTSQECIAELNRKGVVA